MNYSEIVTLVSTLGFPIVMTGALCWFIYTTMNRFMEILNNVSNSIDKLSLKLDHVEKAIKELQKGDDGK